MFEGLVAQRLAALFVAALLLLNFPLLALWDHDLRVWGLPLFPLALFGIWAALILGVAWIVERGGAVRDADPPA
jgi:hypothetical protein